MNDIRKSRLDLMSCKLCNFERRLTRMARDVAIYTTSPHNCQGFPRPIFTPSQAENELGKDLQYC